MNETSSTPCRIVLVEDDLELAELIQDFLSHYEFSVTTVADGITAVDVILSQQPDLVILDIMLPGQSGMDVCRAVRDKYHGMILMQTALGADDYVVKQVKPRLLLSRIRALLRRQERTATADKHELHIGPLCMNLQYRTVSLAQQPIKLTTSEFELLYLLAQRVGTIVTRDDIAQQIRGFEYDGLDR